MNFDRLGQKLRPGTFGNIKVDYTHKNLIKKRNICSDAISADPIYPFPRSTQVRARDDRAPCQSLGVAESQGPVIESAKLRQRPKRLLAQLRCSEVHK